MEKNKTIYSISILILGFIVGWLVAPSFGQKEQIRSGMHMMPNGEMMDDMGHTMDGMISGLVGKTGDEFDREFLEEMIVHHQGAVDMAKMVLATSDRKELIDLANNIISAQEQEIQMMNTWLEEWY